MPWTSEHINWLIDTGERLTTVDGKTVEVWEFRHEEDDEILSLWARHFRNHYCLDSEIDFFVYAIEEIAKNYKKWEMEYEYNKHSNEFVHKEMKGKSNYDLNKWFSLK